MEQFRIYYKGRVGGTFGRMVYFISPSLYYSLYAYKVYLTNQTPGSKNKSHEIKISPMQDLPPILLEIQQFFKDKNLANCTKLIVHGSVATAETIKYSDLDVLIILSHHGLHSKKKLVKIAKALYQSEKLLKKFDPLQHHGWFILTDFDLNTYPTTYFPLELLKHSRIFSKDSPENIIVGLPNEHIHWNAPFKHTAVSLLRKLSNPKIHPTNVFTLKNLLSEFMLLPALYMQARDKKGILKKMSFTSAKEDFEYATWEIMDKVSFIRHSWHYSMNGLQKYILTRVHPAVMRYSKFAAPRIPVEIAQQLQPDFYSKMNLLVKQMQNKIDEL
ncbi:nucleotidyltransferase domain-containing protein [candidate division KSB1 bacterium]|nr:nucleotidyltransferase domain-containing protein [candidate division KSB1 bacterium]